MKRVFVDTGGFFALLVKRDGRHARAAERFAQAEAERWRLVTTNIVVIETYALLLTRTRNGREKAIAFLDTLDETALAQTAVTEIEDIENALQS